MSDKCIIFVSLLGIDQRAMDNSKRKIVFIVNPKSGVQGKEQIVRWIGERIDKKLYDTEIIYTKWAGHAVNIAKEKAAEKVYAVVAIGGDGTINEIARSLVHTDTALGIIPCGSGNGLARHLKVSLDAKKAIDTINEGRLETIDYGLINEIPFFCTCGVGFDAFISLKFAEAGKRGPLTYIEKTIRESINYAPETYEVEIDGQRAVHKAFVIACGNASQYGNNAYIAPRASLNDGLLDVTIIEPFNMREAPSLSFQLFNKTIDQDSHVKTLKCNSLHIKRAKIGVAHFDGDPIMLGESIDVKIVKQGLKVIIPSPKNSSGVLTRAQDYLDDIDAFIEQVSRHNKVILNKGKKQVKKILSQ